MVTDNQTIDYSKDYTELLLNCYMQREKFLQIKHFLSTEESKKDEPIYDVDTAIEVTMKTDSTRAEAMNLAKERKRWKYLV